MGNKKTYIAAIASCIVLVNCQFSTALADVYEVVSAEKISDGRDELICRGWELNVRDVFRELPKYEKAGAYRQHLDECNNFSCSYRGEVKVRGQHYDFEVNAGGYVLVFKPDVEEHDAFFATQIHHLDFLSYCSKDYLRD